MVSPYNKVPLPHSSYWKGFDVSKLHITMIELENFMGKKCSDALGTSLNWGIAPSTSIPFSFLLRHSVIIMPPLSR